MSTSNFGGLEVHFPYASPYPAQKSIMSKVIIALRKGQNALLESPTGTGKSVAFLCSISAYLEAENRREEEEKLQRQLEAASKRDAIEQSPPIVRDAMVDEEGSQCSQDDPSQDEALRALRTIGAQEVISEEKIKSSVPTVYFLSRTHSQLTQLVRELRTTAYTPRMVILGSRKQFCVHPTISVKSSVNEDCNSAIEHNDCSMYHNQYKFAKESSIQPGAVNELWDVEDMVSLGKKLHACPYYGIRGLVDKAQLVFAPYNYIIDPAVRTSMGIELKNAIIVIDEAHNIEDAGREVATGEFRDHDIKLAVDEFERLRNYENAKVLAPVENVSRRVNDYDKIKAESAPMIASLRALHEVSDKLLHWMQTQPLAKSSGNRKDELYQMRYSGESILLVLKQELGIEAKMISQLQKHLDNIASAESKDQKQQSSRDKKNKKGKKTEREEEYLLEKVRRTMGTLLSVVKQMMVTENLHHYKMCLKKEPREKAEWERKQSKYSRNRSRMPDWTYTISFLCLMPSVTFKELESKCRSLILTSGTLAPLSTFELELGVKFHHKLEGNHVIDMQKQLYISTCGHGPKGHQLMGKYSNRDNLAYLDDLGHSVLQLCQTIPDGVLLFFTSYTTMYSSLERWRDIGLYAELEKHKYMAVEPRGGDKKEFDQTVATYKKWSNPQSTERRRSRHRTGAMFSAVLRGKMSEGINFSDHDARGVLIVSVPYPSTFDPKVKLKRDHNDILAKGSQGVLSGNDWYYLQAYRAINQALGRVIRHQNDYGCVVLLDIRYARDTKLRGHLSRWVRDHVKPEQHLLPLITKLTQFFTLLNHAPPAPASAIAATHERLERRAHRTVEIDTRDEPVVGPWTPRIPTEYYQPSPTVQSTVSSSSSASYSATQTSSYEFVRKPRGRKTPRVPNENDDDVVDLTSAAEPVKKSTLSGYGQLRKKRKKQKKEPLVPSMTTMQQTPTSSSTSTLFPPITRIQMQTCCRQCDTILGSLDRYRDEEMYSEQLNGMTVSLPTRAHSKKSQICSLLAKNDIQHADHIMIQSNYDTFVPTEQALTWFMRQKLEHMFHISASQFLAAYVDAETHQVFVPLGCDGCNTMFGFDVAGQSMQENDYKSKNMTLISMPHVREGSDAPVTKLGQRILNVQFQTETFTLPEIHSSQSECEDALTFRCAGADCKRVYGYMTMEALKMTERPEMINWLKERVVRYNDHEMPHQFICQFMEVTPDSPKGLATFINQPSDFVCDSGVLAWFSHQVGVDAVIDRNTGVGYCPLGCPDCSTKLGVRVLNSSGSYFLFSKLRTTFQLVTNTK